MKIEELRNKVGSVCTYRVTFIKPEDAHHYHLYSPAASYLNDDGSYHIRIINNLSDEEKVEAEAHELAHLLVISQGLYQLRIYGDNSINWLKCTINDAISHHLIIKILEADYKISSEGHLKRISQSFRNIKITPLYDDLSLITMGVGLFDIERTVSGSEAKVVEIAKLNHRISDGLNAARNHLKYIDTNLSEDQQIEYIKKFAQELSIPSELLIDG